MKAILLTIIAMIVAVTVAATAFIYSGVYDVRATSPHSALVGWAMSSTMHASVERRARGIEAPNLDDKKLVLSGINDYEAMCVGCHGAPGKKPGAMGIGLNPPAPNLAESAEHLSAAELFWVTKNGIRMTGMPAWGASHEDAALWPVVALMKQLPRMNSIDYGLMLVRAEGHGHHGPDSGDPSKAAQESHGEHGAEQEPTTGHSHSETEPESKSEVPDGHEGHAHDH